MFIKLENMIPSNVRKRVEKYFFYDVTDGTLHWGDPKYIALIKEFHTLKVHYGGNLEMSTEEFLSLTEGEYKETLWQKNNKETENG